MDRYYKILGLSSNATKEDIKKAYHEKIKALHPDKIHGTALEETATFFTTEINEAYEILIGKFEGGKSNLKNNCIEEKILIEGFGKLKYSLSSNFNEIIKAIISRSGIDNANTDDIEWTENTGLSDNVKKSMLKNNAEYSMTIYKEGQDYITIVNRHKGELWYYAYFDVSSKRFAKSKSSYYEDEIYIDSLNRDFKYALSNNLDDIRCAILEKAGYNIKLENEIPQLNPNLSIKVKNMMNKYDVEFSMTTYIDNGNRKIVINRRIKGQWYTISFSEENGKLYRTADLLERERRIKKAHDDYEKDIDNMYAKMEEEQLKADIATNIISGIGKILWNAGGTNWK